MNKGSNQKLPFSKTITFRVMVIILIVLSIGIGSTITYYLFTQNNTILESREKAIQEEGDILHLAIRNNMLAGEAQIAVGLFQSINRSMLGADIKLYRADGNLAFSDNVTLNRVNRLLGMKVFTPKTTFITGKKIGTEDFRRAVKTVDDVFVKKVDSSPRRLISYKPLVNQPKCSRCHGTDHVVRGVIQISSSVDRAYAMTRRNVWFSAGIFGAVVALLTVLMILFMRKIVIERIINIGRIVMGVGQGDFKTKVQIRGNDEICQLAYRINQMIDGLNERFKLTKFVSRSTLDHVRESDEIALGGEKKVMTVLFSDIRGFTRFSENRDPEDVIKTLNDVMNLQSDIIQEFNGDIDKFVGDELMAVFDGKDMVLRALRAAEKIRDTLEEKSRSGENEIFVGIGVNTGDMISGNMGSGARMDRTVIGDAVNLGSRLCSIAGKGTIVLSEYSYKLAAGRIEARMHEPIRIKGKSDPVQIYTLRRTL